LAALIAAANEADSRVYQYVVTRVFPRQVARYGDSLAHDATRWQTLSAGMTHAREPLWAVFKRNCIYKQCLRLRII
jgi:hypothetical protein